ncbi:defensin-like protein 17 isoform X2 [Vicia villosa]|uniref:defensin-like protein 17 isoform X2 n=1 Tax=Vicia villosa TaxID=3911 RepID=UPI00273C9240|nr:defensin-like protein 17 isoform X2 [Vicia villosa]
MTLSTIKPCTLFMFICLVLLLISTWEVEAKIFCGRPSRTWSGPCIDTECDRECIDSEVCAMSGSCEGIHACFERWVIKAKG